MNAFLSGLVGLVVGVFGGVAMLILLMPTKKVPQPRQLRMAKSRWRIQVDGAEVLVRTGYAEIPYEGHVAERWRFDPTDVDSRAETLAQAEDYLAGLRDVEQRAREINGR